MIHARKEELMIRPRVGVGAVLAAVLLLPALGPAQSNIGGAATDVDGGYALSGARMPDGKELPERRGHLTAVLLAEGGQWPIAASRLMIPTELPYK
jgi:hypothetical protein